MPAIAVNGMIQMPNMLFKQQLTDLHLFLLVNPSKYCTMKDHENVTAWCHYRGDSKHSSFPPPKISDNLIQYQPWPPHFLAFKPRYLGQFDSCGQCCDSTRRTPDINSYILVLCVCPECVEMLQEPFLITKGTCLCGHAKFLRTAFGYDHGPKHCCPTSKDLVPALKSSVRNYSMYTCVLYTAKSVHLSVFLCHVFLSPDTTSSIWFRE